MFFSKVAPETWSLITPFIHEILDELYDHALEHDSTAKLYAGQNIEGLKAVQKTHWAFTRKNWADPQHYYRQLRVYDGSFDATHLDVWNDDQTVCLRQKNT